MRKWLIICTLLALSVMGYAIARQRFIKSTYVSDGAVAISCSNGGDPTGQKIGDMLIISCGTRK